MRKNPDYQTVKIILCQEIERINKHAGTLQSTTTLRSALDKICREYGGKRDDNEKALLHVWNDLYRNGDIIPGTGISELSPSFFQVTDKGNENFEYLNRDPGNPQGYLEHLSKKAKKAFLYGIRKKWVRMQFIRPKNGKKWPDYVSWKGVIFEAFEKYKKAKSESYKKRMEAFKTS